jgi:hypothetical protein
MSGFRNAQIFGLKVGASLEELRQESNTVLKNLNLNPADFNRLDLIGDPNEGIPNTFQKLSNLKENLLLKADSIRSETSKYDDVLNLSYQSNANFRTNNYNLKGNINVNGRLSARSITQRTFNETTKSFVKAPITTSINSAWDSTGTTISLGQGLKISSHADAKIITGKLKNVHRFVARKFAAEKATHKIEVTINGVAYYMYAIKNNPFKFDGDFKSIKSYTVDGKTSVQITNNDGSDISYVTTTIDNDGNEVESEEKTVDGDGTDATNIDGLADGTSLKVYTNPDNVDVLKITHGGLTELPQGVKFKLVSAESVDLSNNKFTEFPNFKKVFPNFKQISIQYNNPDISISSFDDLKNKIPDDITLLNIQNTIKSGTNVDDTSSSPHGPLNLDQQPFNLLERVWFNGCGFTGFVPKISSSLKTFAVASNDFSILTEDTFPASCSVDTWRLNSNRNLMVDDVSPLEDHKYYKNTSYADSLSSLYVDITKLGIPNVSGKTNLKEFFGHTMSYDDRGDKTNDVRFQIVDGGESKFKDCTSLTKINLNESKALHGPIPSFETNTKLDFLGMNRTHMVNPTGNALENLCFPGTLRTFTYIYANDSDYDFSPRASNTLPENAFCFTDTENNNEITPVPFNRFDYISYGITGGTFPKIQGKVINVTNNEFTTLTPLVEENATILESFVANDNKFTGSLNLDNLFVGEGEYEKLTKIDFENNLFTSFASNSISSVKFANLKELNLKNAFDDQSPQDLVLRSFKELSDLTDIDVSDNTFTSVDTNIFNGCTALNNFSMDTDDIDVFTDVLSNIELYTGSSVFPNDKNFSFQSLSSNPKVDIKIANYSTKRTYTAEEENKFLLNDRIRALEAKRVLINDIDLDPKYAETPDQPTNLSVVISNVNEVTLSFDQISLADRVIVEIRSYSSPNIEIVELSGDATGYVHTDFQSGDTLYYEVYGENTRSIIKNIVSKFSINAPTEDSSPPV